MAGTAASSCLPVASEAWWAAPWAICEAIEAPRLPRAGLVRTVRVGRAVAPPVASPVTAAVKSAGTSSAA